MKMLRAWIRRIAGLFTQGRREREFAAEMESNLEMHIQDNMRSGMSLEEARRQALVRFGGANTARDRYHQQSSLPFLETLLQDLRYGARMLRKSPAFTFVAVLTLALGIGANTAIFSVINAVLLRPLPFPDPDRLVQLWETEASPGNYPLTGPDYLDWQEQNRTLESMALYSWPQSANASRSGEAQPVAEVATQASFFSVFGVQTAMGRTFAPGEDEAGKERVVVISDGFWKKFMAARADVIGQKLELNSEAYTVIGVMPDWFNSAAQVWVPMDMAKAKKGRGSHSYRAIARIRAGSSVTAAAADLLGISQLLEKQYPENNSKVHAVVVPLKEQITGSSQPQLIVLLVAVAAVLLVACVNVANLLLARATRRQREIALRVVLGASRVRVVRQLLTESVLLSLMGAAVGLFGAWWAIVLIRSSNVLPIPRVNVVQLDLTVLAFTVLVSVLVGILFGLAPALQASKADLAEELKASAQAVVSQLGWQRLLRDALVIGEIAISLALLSSAGLLLRSFSNMCTANVGVQPQNVMTMSVMLPEARYSTSTQQREFIDGYLERLQHSPGIQSAAIATELPLEGGNNGYIEAEGDADTAHANQLVENNYITPDYFQALGIPFLHGVNFSLADLEHASEVNREITELVKKNPNIEKLPPGLHIVAIINRKMAETFWPGQDAVGKTFKDKGDSLPIRVIGVVADTSVFGIQKKPFPEAYYPITIAVGWKGFLGQVIVKAGNEPTSVLPTMRSQLKAIDSSLAAFQPRTMQQIIDESTQSTGVQTWLLGSFAALALLLAAVGLYSVLAYLVTQRTREIGIRMALGAQHSHVLRLVVGHGGKLTLAGVVLGVIAALFFTRLLKSLLFGIEAKDPLTLAGVVVLMALVAVAACYVPAHRAMRVEPMVALRDE